MVIKGRWIFRTKGNCAVVESRPKKPRPEKKKKKKKTGEKNQNKYPRQNPSAMPPSDGTPQLSERELAELYRWIRHIPTERASGSEASVLGVPVTRIISAAAALDVIDHASPGAVRVQVRRAVYAAARDVASIEAAASSSAAESASPARGKLGAPSPRLFAGT
jgi:hypothetical protein